MNDSAIFMVNLGMAFMGYRQLDFGMPFFASFDRNSGKQLFFSLLNEKDDPVLSFQIQNQEIYFAFKNRIAKYSMETGKMVTEKEFSKDNFGELKYFTGNQVFTTDQKGKMMSLSQTDSTKVFVLTSLGKTLSIDNELNISETIENKDLSINYLKIKDYKFIARDKKTLIINNAGQSIAEVKATSNAFIVGNTLYDTQDKHFIAIDLSGIIQNE
jgi:hypothetical protein